MSDTLEDQPSYSPGRKWRAGFSVVVGSIALLAIVVMVNFISRTDFFHRAFLSSQTRVQLSGQTLGLLKSITNDVKITLYYDKTDPMFNMISLLATEYRLANPKISIETVDYTRDTVTAQQVKAKYHLDAPTDKDLVIFDCDGHSKHVNGNALTETTLEAVDNEREREFRRRPVAFKGEMMFSAMLLAVTSPQPLNAYYLAGHREWPVEKEDNEFDYQKFVSLVEQNYVRVRGLSLLGTNEVPSDCNLLIIAGPRDIIPQAELDKIEGYLEAGGRLLALLDYASAERPVGLESLLAKWGVSVGRDAIKDPTQTYLGHDQDIVISGFAKHPVVNPLLLSGIHVIMPRPVGINKAASSAADAPRVTELAFTSPNAVLVGKHDLPPTNYPVAVAVEKGAVPGTSTDLATTRILVVGDSYLFVNGMINNLANRDFASYAINWLLDRTQLLEGLGPSPVTERRLVMTRSQMKSAQWILLGGLPGAFLLLGGLVWLRRRN